MAVISQSVKDFLVKFKNYKDPVLGGADRDNVFANEVVKLKQGFTVDSLITANYSAAVYDSLALDSSGGAFSVTLPAAPIFGNKICVTDVTASLGTNNVTLLRNGKKIQGLSSDLVLNISGDRVELIYINTLQGWRVYT